MKPEPGHCGPCVLPFEARSATASADDLAIASHRMRHLMPWHIEPLPIMHSAIGTPTKSLAAGSRERHKQIALHVLAVQIWLAKAQSAIY